MLRNGFAFHVRGFGCVQNLVLSTWNCVDHMIPFMETSKMFINFGPDCGEKTLI